MSYDLHITKPSRTNEEAVKIAKAITEKTKYDVKVEVGEDRAYVFVKDGEDGVVVEWYSVENVSYNGTLRGDYDRDDMLEVAAFVFGSRFYDISEPTYGRGGWDLDEFIDGLLEDEAA